MVYMEFSSEEKNRLSIQGYNNYWWLPVINWKIQTTLFYEMGGQNKTSSWPICSENLLGLRENSPIHFSLCSCIESMAAVDADVCFVNLKL